MIEGTALVLLVIALVLLVIVLVLLVTIRVLFITVLVYRRWKAGQGAHDAEKPQDAQEPSSLISTLHTPTRRSSPTLHVVHLQRCTSFISTLHVVDFNAARR